MTGCACSMLESHKNAFKIQIQNSDEMRPPQRFYHTWKYNIKMYLIERVSKDKFGLD